jgi:putative transcriptional regulator
MRELNSSDAASIAGSLLVAHPALRDGNFRRTVILMTADGTSGSMGVVVNRPLPKPLGALGGDFALGPLASVPVFQGGPVQTEQLILAAWQAQARGFQLHLGLEPERAAALMSEKDTFVRAYFGYAGWSAGQLQNELKHQTWIVTNAPLNLFSQPGDQSLWRSTLARQGPEWRLLSNEPEDPDRN